MLTVDTFTGPLTRDVVETIMLVESAQENPIQAALIAAGAIAPTASEKFEWFDQSPNGRRTQINNAPDDYDETDTVLTVDDGSLFYPNALVYCEATGEVLLVDSISTNDVTVQRGIGQTTAAAESVADDAYLTIIGHGAGEGAGLGTVRAFNPSPHSNYVQTFRTPISMSGRMQRVQTLTEDEKARLRRAAFRETMSDIEQAIIRGTMSDGETDVNGDRVTTTGGLLEFIATNIYNVAGNITWDNTVAWAEDVFAIGSPEKLCFTGPTLLTYFGQVASDYMSMGNLEEAIGLRVRRIETPHGVLTLVPHRGMKGDLANAGIVVDPEHARLRHTNGGRTVLRSGVQNPDVDGSTDEWFTELGLETGTEAAHAVIKNVTGSA